MTSQRQGNIFCFFLIVNMFCFLICISSVCRLFDLFNCFKVIYIGI